MNPKRPANTYLRSPNGFKDRKVFKRLLQHQSEGAFILKNKMGFEIIIPAHFFESAYRRVKNIHSTKPLQATYIPSSEIERLVSFIKVAEGMNQNREYGLGTIQLILDVADSATRQRKHLVKKLNNLSEQQIINLKRGLVDFAIKNKKARVMEMSYQQAIDDQKLKFSSRANRYPFVFSILYNNPDKVLLNTVYRKGDIYPLNTLIVFGI